MSMSEKREPFFTTDEWKALAVFRPREWRGWWRTQPLVSKIFVGVPVALGACGLYEVARGDRQVGWNLVTVVACLLLFLFVLVPLVFVLVAAVRWVLRAVGVASWWRRARGGVLALGKFVFWVGFAGLVLVGLSPYLSWDPVRSWHALMQGVPVERVEVAKKPHDCEFATAPIGSKHCHYVATVEALNLDGKKWVLVTYSKVEE